MKTKGEAELERRLATGRESRASGIGYMIALLALSIIVSYLDRGVIAVLVPNLKRTFGLNDIEVSLLQGISFSLPFAIASLPVGRLVDRFNRRNIIVVGIVTWSVSTMMCGLAPSFWQLYAARAGIGIGEACLLPAAYSMVADSFKAEWRGRAMSILTVATAVGGGSSALLGGALLTLWNGAEVVHLPLVGAVETWRAVFLVAGTPGFPVALLMLAVREPRRNAPAAQQAEVSDFAGHALRNWRLFVPLYLAFSSIFFLSYAVALWSPSVLSRIYGFAAGTAGMASGSLQLGGSITGSILAGLIGDMLITRGSKYGRLRLWIIGLVPALLAALFLALPAAYFYLIGVGLAIFASGLLTAVSYPALYDAVAPSMRGRSLAVYLFLGNVLGFGGGTLGVALITEHVFANEMSINCSVALAVGGATFVAILMTIIMLRRYENARLVHQQENAAIYQHNGQEGANG